MITKIYIISQIIKEGLKTAVTKAKNVQNHNIAKNHLP